MSLQSANAGINLTTLLTFIRSWDQLNTDAFLSQGFLSTTYVLGTELQTGEKIYRDVSNVNGGWGGMQTNNYQWGGDGSTRGVHKGSTGKGAPGKMSREGDTVVELAGDKLGGTLQLREMRCKHNMSRWSETDGAGWNVFEISFWERGKGRKIRKICMLSILFFWYR